MKTVKTRKEARSVKTLNRTVSLPNRFKIGGKRTENAANDGVSAESANRPQRETQKPEGAKNVAGGVRDIAGGAKVVAGDAKPVVRDTSRSLGTGAITAAKTAVPVPVKSAGLKVKTASRGVKTVTRGVKIAAKGVKATAKGVKTAARIAKTAVGTAAGASASGDGRDTSQVPAQNAAAETAQNAAQSAAAATGKAAGRLAAKATGKAVKSLARGLFRAATKNNAERAGRIAEVRKTVKEIGNGLPRERAAAQSAGNAARSATPGANAERIKSRIKRVRQSEKRTPKRVSGERRALSRRTSRAGNAPRTGKSAKSAAGTQGKNVASSAENAAADAAQNAAAKAAKAAGRAAGKAALKLTAKAARAGTKAFAKLAVRVAAALFKAVVALVQGLFALILAGGWTVLLVLIVVLLIGMLLSSAFGIFFSGEDDGATTTADAIAEINEEYEARIAEIKSSVFYYEVEISGSRAPWKDILAVYAVKLATDGTDGDTPASMTDAKADVLRDVFWAMNAITHYTEEREVLEDVYDLAGNPAGQALVPKTYLIITVSGKTADEAAAFFGFTDEQKAYLAELLSGDYTEEWSYALYGASSADGMIVSVALSQVGNAGDRYWMWWGYRARVEWCAIFVSWAASECGHIDEGLIPLYQNCVSGSAWFKARGLWRDPGFEPSPGHLIFFDWERDGVTDHTGIVERYEGGTVFTVEGNSSDLVRRRSYSVYSPFIYGYGAPAYPEAS